MKRAQPWVWVAGAAAAALLLAAFASGAGSPPVSQKRLLVVGDSLAVGLGPQLTSLAKQSGIAFVAVEAKVGTTTSYWDGRVAALLARYTPDLVIVVLGTNDAAMTDPSVNAGAIQRIVSTVSASGARLIWVGMPVLPARLKADAVRQTIQSTGVDYLDSRQFTFERTPDGIHATPSGYAAWARAIWSYVVPR